MLFDLDDSGPQISLQHIFDSFDFQTHDVQVESLVAHSASHATAVHGFACLSGGSLLDLLVSHVYLLANGFDQSMLVREKLGCHLLLGEELAHLDHVDVQRAISLLKAYFIDQGIIVIVSISVEITNVDVLTVVVFIILAIAAEQISSKPL